MLDCSIEPTRIPDIKIEDSIFTSGEVKSDDGFVRLKENENTVPLSKLSTATASLRVPGTFDQIPLLPKKADDEEIGKRELSSVTEPTRFEIVIAEFRSKI